MGEDEATAILEEEMDSPFIIDQSPVGTIVDGVVGPSLVPHGEKVRPSKDPLIWPHPVDPHEALLMVNDMAEQDTWAGAS